MNRITSYNVCYTKLLRLTIVTPFFAGCAFRTASPPERKPADLIDYFPAPKNGDRYYYFVESELQRREGKLDRALTLLNKAVERDTESLYRNNFV